MNPIREDLKAYVDGELSAARMEEVRLAVASDPSLQQEVDDMRLLGFEIKKLASEPAVVGKEAVLDKVRRPKAPWWDPSRLSGRLAYAGALFFVLAGVGAVLFPVFSQAKESARMNSRAAAERDAMPAAGADSAILTEGAAEFRAPGSPMFSDRTKSPSDGAVGLNQGVRGRGFDDDAAGKSMNGTVGGGGGEPSRTPGAAAPGDRGYVEGEVFSAEEQPPAASTPMVMEKVDAGRNARRAYGAKSRTTPKTEVKANTNTNTSVPEVPPTQRMVVKNADIDLKVDDAKRALEDAQDLAKKLGGYSEGGNLTSMEGQTPRSSCVLRVKADLYETAMKALRGMGEVLSETSNAQDVTAQHADTVGRLTVLRAEAESYVTMLRGAKKIGEIMEIKDRLSQVRQEIASLEAQRKALQNESALSTIRATFTQKETVDKKKDDKKSGFDETWAKAQNGLSNVGEFLGNLMIYIFVFSPVWLPPVLLFWWLGKKARA